MTKFREKIRSGEVLAVHAKTTADIYDLLASMPQPNRMMGGACVVTVRGELEHHECAYGDSYDRIRRDLTEALTSEESQCVVLDIDSRGGVVSGLNSLVYDMRALRKTSGKPIYVYVNETGASAAYALSCIGDEVYLPPGARIGSIGVISQLATQARADVKAGIDFVILTSGEHKADGNSHLPISQGAIDEETKHLTKYATQFFKLVKTARGINAEPLQARMFIAKEAVGKGLADGVMGWETLMAKIGLAYPAKEVSESNETQKRLDVSHSVEKPSMSLSIKAAIAQTEAAIKSEKDTDKLMALYSDLKAYKHVYKKTTEETEKFQDEEEDAKKADEDASKSDDEKKADDDGDDAKSEDGDDDSKSGTGTDSSSTSGESEKASKDRAAVIAMLAADIRGASGKQKETLKASLAALTSLQDELAARRAKNAALRGENKALAAVSKDVAGLKAAATEAKLLAIVDVRRRDLTPAERKMLLAKAAAGDAKYVKAFLDACPPGRLRHLVDPTAPDLEASAQQAGYDFGNAPEHVVTATITDEMKEAAARVAEMTGGKISAEASLEAYRQTRKNGGIPIATVMPTKGGN